jgi:hypothetical protein
MAQQGRGWLPLLDPCNAGPAAGCPCQVLRNALCESVVVVLLLKVLVVRLLTAGSVEEHIVAVAAQKRKFADSSITGV